MNYKKIKTLQQYTDYSKKHEALFLEERPEDEDEIELLEVLIQDYDTRNSKSTNHNLNPVELLNSLLENADLSQIELANQINVSKQLVSDILNYRRNISKEMVLKLSDFFSMSQEAFSRPYDLMDPSNKELKLVPEVLAASRKKTSTRNQ